MRSTINAIGGHLDFSGPRHERDKVGLALDEYRHLTFIFCDLVDSTGMSQHLDQEDWRALLIAFQDCTAEVIRRHGGRIHEQQGDGFIAYFGYPASYDDTARRAVHSGLDIAQRCQELFTQQNASLQRAGHGPVQVRIGVHTGPVVIGEMDGKDTATGFTITYSERLHGVAPLNGVVISRETLHLLKNAFDVEAMPGQKLKGIAEPQTVYLVQGEATATASRLTQFAGREREMAMLRREWRAIEHGRPRAVLVTGEAGIGKSRLLSEFCTRVESAPATVLEWRCSPYFRNTAMYPVAEGLRAIVDTSSAAKDPLDAIEALTPDGLSPTQFVPAIASLLSLDSTPRFPQPAFTAEERRHTIQTAVLNWLAGEARRQPILLLIEDAKWIDPSSLAFLEQLTDQSDTGPILVLLAYRTEPAETWTCPFAARPIDLGRLPEAAARDIVRSLSGGAALAEKTVKKLVRRTDGVPLFIEESAVMLISSDAPEGSEDLPPKADKSASGVPARLMDLLAARLDRVGKARITAGLAATIGREFSFDLLNAVADADAEALRQDLDTLVNAGLVISQAGSERHEYSFKHALVKDAAYGNLVKSRRRSAHLRIAQALQEDKSIGVAALPELLAYHFMTGGNYAAAI
ncbi:MAG: ATP-binding protein, partial [Gammaproteobacteria bacterium]